MSQRDQKPLFRLLFWNLKRNHRLIPLLTEVILSRHVDLLVLAESAENLTELQDALSKSTQSVFTAHTGLINKRICVLARDTVAVLPVVAESQYLMVLPIRFGSVELLLAAMHGISRLEDELEDINAEAIIAAEFLRNAERDYGNRRTILVGDFNLSPFDAGMAKAQGFFGVMTQADAERDIQRLKYKDYPLFYNPMWSRLGDESPGPPGTFYRKRSSHLSYYWHTYDQVLLRPSLIDGYHSTNLEVLTKIGDHELLKSGVPDEKRYSDHLPILLGLDVSKVGV